MNAIAILFALGVVLLAFEVIVPGGVLGILGALALMGGVVVAFLGYGVSGGLAAFGIALVLIAIMLVLEFVVIPRTKLGRRMFLRAEITGKSQPVLGDVSLIGRAGEAVTPLVPSGLVRIEGRQYEAFSQSGPIDPGDALRVVGMDNFRVVVTKS